MSEMRTVPIAFGGGRAVSLTAPSHLYIPAVIERDGVGGHEPHAIACCLAGMQIRSGAFYDVGSNVGIFSIVVASALNRQCIAFEPTPELAAVAESAASNHYLPLQVRRLALGAEPGRQTFYLSARSDASNSLNPEFRKHAGELPVDVSTLDISAETPVGVLKIDTETTEPDVIRGGLKTIIRDRPHMVVEVLPSGDTVDFMNTFLERSGYVAYHINSRPVWKLTRTIDVSGIREDRNWLFSPEPLAGPFWTYLDAWRWRLTKR